MSGITLDTAPQRAVVRFDCNGQAVGKMRKELDVRMVQPFEERFDLATDEGAFHGGDASAPLALFVAGLTGCVMTQIRAFAKRLGVGLNDLTVETRVEWDWQRAGKVYETAPKSFAIDVLIGSDAPLDRQLDLVSAAKKRMFPRTDTGPEKPDHPPAEDSGRLGRSRLGRHFPVPRHEPCDVGL